MGPKIWGGIPNVSGVYGKQTNTGKVTKSSEVSMGSDVCNISDAAKKQSKDYQTVMRALADVPDVDPDKVTHYTEIIDKGQYNINGKDIADKILNHK